LQGAEQWNTSKFAPLRASLKAKELSEWPENEENPLKSFQLYEGGDQDQAGPTFKPSFGPVLRK
jgi:hypothetical protein